MPDSSIVADLRQHSWATISLSAEQSDALAALRNEASKFFSQAEGTKRGHGSEDFNFGFRPYGRQYSISPDRPDMNESFTFWADNPATIPGHDATTVAPFIRPLRAYWTVAADIAEDILASVAAWYGEPSTVIPFRNHSYLEVNWYYPSDRDLLQDRHEDGHLFTLAIPDSPGLEIEVSGRMEPFQVRENQLLVMPGSLLTTMTAGEISPLYHQVRNHHLRRRLTVLFLVNPPLDRSVHPFVRSEDDQVDVAELARAKGTMFGLPLAPTNPDLITTAE